MRIVPPVTLLAAAAALSLAASAAGAADAAKGKRVFNKCKACHTLVEGRNRIGPSLAGLFGRTAGTYEGYSFSGAMKEAGEKGLVWTPETLSEYLAKPRTFIRGTKMTFVGLKKKAEREDLNAFLKEATRTSR